MDVGAAQAVWDFLNAGGVLGVLVFVLWAVYSGKLVTRREFDDLKEDRDRWRESSLRATDLSDRALLEAERRGFETSRRSSSENHTT